MAKKVVKPDEEAGASIDIQPEAPDNNETPNVKEEQPITKDSSPFIENILKVYPAYPALYIDSHGSCYTTDTPASMRKGAILYENPFYQP